MTGSPELFPSPREVCLDIIFFFFCIKKEKKSQAFDRPPSDRSEF